jgi:hypothetical protein
MNRKCLIKTISATTQRKTTNVTTQRRTRKTPKRTITSLCQLHFAAPAHDAAKLVTLLAHQEMEVRQSANVQAVTDTPLNFKAKCKWRRNSL